MSENNDQQLHLKRADPLPHTPGPWRVARKSDGHGWTIVGPSPREHDRPMEWMVARTVSDEFEDEANVRLIALAPELLATLKWLDARGSLGLDVHARLAELIAKAEGR